MQRTNLHKFIITMLTLMLVSFSYTTAQDTPVISISLPLHQDGIPADAFDNFEAEYGVRVHVISNPTGVYLSSPAENTQAHLDELRTYTESADILYVNNYTLTGIGANTNFFLNMNPLANGDTTLNPSDFYPAAWQAFQWDGRLLALPLSFDTLVMGYNPAAFDAVNLNYPSGNWTIDDFAFAARMLTQYDANGAIMQAGYESSFFDVHLIHAFVEQSLLDVSQFPPVLDIANPQLSYVLEVWNELKAEGIIGQGDSMANTVSTMTLFSSSFFNGSSASAALLPGHRAGLDISGYGISSGTQYPELAYALAQELTTNESLIAAHFQTYAARTSIPASNTLSPQVMTILDESIQTTIPYSEMRYADYLRQAMNSADVLASLETMRVNLSAALQTAQQFGIETRLIVESAPVIGDGIVLNFGVTTTILPLPNQTQWELAISEFIAMDNEVSWVELAGANRKLEDYPATYDCFVLSADAINSLDPATILRIDPLMMSDTAFNPDNFVGNTLDSLSSNGEIYAYPLTIAPRLLAVNSALMENTGVTIVDSSWSIDQFTDTVTQWQQNTGTFAYMLVDSVDVLTLVAAYGGLPLDYSSNPPGVDFTSADNVEALRQVLDLARNGILGYNSLLEIAPMGTALAATPIRNQYLSPAGFGAAPEQTQYVNFPAGINNTVASYRLSAGAISAQTQYPEACYRWLSFISRQGYIFQSIPVLHSVPGATQNTQFARYADVLQSPDVINIPYINKAGNDDRFVLQYMLNRAMDAYVLNGADGADLNSVLQLAQANAERYLQCRATGDTVQNCASTILPDIQNFLS